MKQDSTSKWDDKISVALSKGKIEYDVIIANYTYDKGTGLTLNDLEEAMRIQWRITYGGVDSSDGGKEFTL